MPARQRRCSRPVHNPAPFEPASTVSELHRFLFDGLPVRGLLVRLSDDWREVLARRGGAGQAFAGPVQGLMGEMAAAAVLMHGNVKFDGDLILQIFGDGPVKLAVAEVRADLGFRVTAKVVGELAPGADLQSMLDVHGGGRCAISLLPRQSLPGRQPYQGVVSLRGDDNLPMPTLAAMLEHYMRQSEQLETRLVLAADERAACGLLLQRLPRTETRDADGESDDAFHRLGLLAATLTRDELLGLDVEAILRRLFWDEPLRLLPADLPARRPHFACTCSRERVAAMLQCLGRAEVDDIVREQGEVEVGCDFCGAMQRFDPVDALELFTPRRDQPPVPTTLN